MGSIPLPALGVQTPVNNAYSEYLRMAQLQQQNDAMKQQTEQQAQAFPVEQQQRQATVQQTQLENQAKEQQAAQEKQAAALQPKFVQRDENGKATGFDNEGYENALTEAGLGKYAIAHQTQRADAVSKLALADEKTRQKIKDVHQGMYERLEGLKKVSDPAERQQYYLSGLHWAQQNGIDVGQWPTQAPANDQLTHMEGDLGMSGQLLADADKQADINKKNAEAQGPAAEREFQSYYKRWLAGNNLQPSAANEYKAQQQYFKDKQPFGAQRLVLENRKLDQADQRLEQGEQRIGVKDRDFIDKNYVKPANDKEQSYQMFMDAYNNRNNAKTGAESMLALSTHLATTFGNVKGARVTKDMIEHHLGARGITDKAQVAVQKLVNGDELAPDQWDAFKNLITNARNLSWQTAQKEAKAKNYDISGSLPDDLKPKSDFSVKAPNGKTYTFKDQQSLDNFKKAANLQ